MSGLEHVSPHRPALLVGNHTLWAVLDSPLLLITIHEMLGIVPRTVGDHIHFRVPAWRALLERFGVVDGTPENVRALMDAGEWIVLFPGGAREVFKGRGEKYALLWGERTGFARLAVECGYPIVRSWPAYWRHARPGGATARQSSRSVRMSRRPRYCSA